MHDQNVTSLHNCIYNKNMETALTSCLHVLISSSKYNSKHLFSKNVLKCSLKMCLLRTIQKINVKSELNFGNINIF